MDETFTAADDMSQVLDKIQPRHENIDETTKVVSASTVAALRPRRQAAGQLDTIYFYK